MCPVCLSSVAWLITDGVSVLGATAGGVAIVRDRKSATRISKIWKLRTREPLPSGLVLRGLKTNGAPRGSPWTRARAAAVISESIGIPPHLSLPGRSIPASVFVPGHHALGHSEHANEKPTSDEGEKGNDDTGNALRRGQIRSSEEGHMCPACIASTAVMVAGAGSTGGILALCIGKFRNFFRVSSLSLFQKRKEK
jgi:hypothetical protein